VTAGNYCTNGCKLASYPPAVILTASQPAAVPLPSSTTSQEVLGEKLAPVLKIEKSAGKETVKPGEKVDFKIIITNAGNLDAYDVRIDDDLPAGMEYESGGAIWELGNLAPGESEAITYKVKVADSAEDGKYANIAYASALNHDKVSAEAQINVRKPMVLGQKLPETGFEPAEMAILALMTAIIGFLAVRIGKCCSKESWKRPS